MTESTFGLPLAGAATAHEARVVLDVTGYGYRGYAADWARMLCEFAFKCDRVNRAKLRYSFPEMVDAVNVYERISLNAICTLARNEAAS